MNRPDDLGQFETVQFTKVRDLAERFEQAWETQQDTSKGVDLTPFLPDASDSLRLPALYELVKTDLACRWQRGLPISLEDYLEKYPELGPLDRVSPVLVFEEFRIRTQHGVVTPLNVYKKRFPKQFDEFEKLVQAEPQSAMTAPSNPVNHTASSPPADTQASITGPLALLSQGVIVGGHYRLNKRIGAGGFGEVWLGNDTHGNIEKAIKIITRSVESDEAKTELNALEIIKRLNHPCLLRTEGFFAEQERLIVVMELADGSLRDVLKKYKKETGSGVPVEKLIRYVRFAAEAIDYLHEEGVFHRDIKPENILLVGKTAKVADFGLAKLSQNRQSTKTNFAGTGAYSPPETWKGRVTNKSDQYSLAITYAECRLGKMIFKGNTIYEFMIEHLQSQPNLDALPEAERSVLFKALEKEPENRFSNCTEFVRALEQAVGESGAIPVSSAGTGEGFASRPTPASGLGSKTRPQSGSKGDLSLASIQHSSIPQRTPTSGKHQATEIPDWKANQSAVAPDTQRPIIRRRRGRGPKVLLAVVLLLVGFMVTITGLSFYARKNLDDRAQALAGNHEYATALKEIDEGGLLVLPFREDLRESVLQRGLEQAEKAHLSGHVDDLVKITVGLHEAFPKSEKAPTLLEKSYQGLIKDLVRREKYPEAFRRLKDLPLEIPAKRDLLPEVRKQWLEGAWIALVGDNPEYAKAQLIASDYLKVDPDDPDARDIQSLAPVADKIKSFLAEGKYKETLEKIPVKLPARAQKLGKQLRDEVRKAWLAKAHTLLDNKAYELAQDEMARFLSNFRTDGEGRVLMTTVLEGRLTGLLAKAQFADAMRFLAPLNREFPELENKVKAAWRDQEVKRFKGNDGEKEKALKGLQMLRTFFPDDFQLREDYRNFQSELLHSYLKQIDSTLKSKAYDKAIGLIAHAEEFAPGSGQETPLKSLKLLALLEKPKRTPDEVKAVADLLPEVVKENGKAVQFEQVMTRLITAGKSDENLMSAIAKNLPLIPEHVSPDHIPVDFWAFASISRPKVDEAFGAGKLLRDAQGMFAKSSYKDALKTLSQIDLKKETDRNFQKEYYTLYAKLGEKGELSREQLRALVPELKEHPSLGPYLNKGMTQFLTKTWKDWPEKAEAWEARLSDIELADPQQPLVLAMKAEALLETGAKADVALVPGNGEVKGFVDFVQARLLATKREPTQAAKVIEKIDGDAEWLAPERRKQAAQILQVAALELTRTPDGGRRLFKNAVEAGQAYAWQSKAMELTGKNGDDGLSTLARLNLALAAACKTPPDFSRCTKLGQTLLDKNRAEIGAERITLVLVNPTAFEKELQSLKKDFEVGLEDVSNVLKIGESQLAALPNQPDLRIRQGRLFGVKGWVLEQLPDSKVEDIFAAYTNAKELDPKNKSYEVALGRSSAGLALSRAAKERDLVARIRTWRQGLADSEDAFQANDSQDPNWADLCLQRSQLALELGNHLDKKSAEYKQMFRDARRFAEQARDAKVPHTKPAFVWIALGNACEDLAHFARLDVDKNYKDSTDAFEKAIKIEPESSYNRGRCYFRWATSDLARLDEAKKNDLFRLAVADLKAVAASPRSKNAAEAGYWLGYSHWYLGESADAFQAFDRSIQTAKKHNQLVWGRFSFDSICDLARAQIQNAPEKAQEWLRTANDLYRSVKSTDDFKGAEQKINDVSAEVSVRLANVYAEKQSLREAKGHLDEAVRLKHSTKHHQHSIDRAVFLKVFRTKLGIPPNDLTTAHDQAVAAIEAATSLSADEKKSKRDEFEKIWNKIP